MKNGDGLERGEWELTPAWQFWNPKWRRPVYAFFGHRCRWEYVDVLPHGAA